VSGFDPDYSLNFLDFSGGQFLVPGPALPTGANVRLRVAARDVSLTLNLQKDTSILNIFEATVTSLSKQGAARMLVQLDVGGLALLAHVTRKSAETLGLRPGMALCAQVKSVAVLS